MKKVVQINTVCNGSIGKVMAHNKVEYEKDGYEVITFYGRRKLYNGLVGKKFGNFFSFWFHVALTTVFDKHGYGSYFVTKKMIKSLKKEIPEIIDLHNVHGYYLNLPLFFNYLKNEYQGKVVWTLHDCWTFTGHCPYFDYAKCNKWQTGCSHCPNKKQYPISLFLDNSKNNYRKKKELFTGINNLTIVTPSEWLKKSVNQSFLKEYPVIVKHNQINTNIFKKDYDLSILDKYKLPKNKTILLGVANVWEPRKGLNDFIELSKMLDNNYQIVLVGVNKKQKKLLANNNIIGIEHTDNQKDLVKLYSVSYYFINPTYEDNYPTVNLEATACGLYTICYDTGGCREQINNSNGVIIPVGDVKKIIEEVKKNEKNM